jgi:hypothetical protein
VQRTLWIAFGYGANVLSNRQQKSPAFAPDFSVGGTLQLLVLVLLAAGLAALLTTLLAGLLASLLLLAGLLAAALLLAGLLTRVLVLLARIRVLVGHVWDLPFF